MRAELERFRAVQMGLSKRAQGALEALWASLDPDDRATMVEAVRTASVDVLTALGEVSAVAGADFYAEVREGHRLPAYTPEIPDPAPTSQILAATGWALSTPDILGNLRKVADRLVKAPGRNAVVDNAIADPATVLYIRVPSGPITCEFCALRAAVGKAVPAEFAKEYHDHCDCEGAPVFDGDPLPDGFDPSHYEAIAANPHGTAR